MSGRRYRAWARLIHHFGYHYAPEKWLPEPHDPRLGIDGRPVTEWYHWCQWCGLRGRTFTARADAEDGKP